MCHCVLFSILVGGCVPSPTEHDDAAPAMDTPVPARETAETGHTGDTGDTALDVDCPNGVYDGATSVATVVLECTQDEARFDVVLVGVSAAGSAVVFMQETGNIEPQWSEEHPLGSAASDVCGFSEDLRQVIGSLHVPVFAWVPGVSSVFACTAHLADPYVMTFAVFVEDADDPSTTDCFVVGDDPAGLIADFYSRAGIDPSFDLAGCRTP